MLGERELWACAAQTIRANGEEAESFAASRIAALDASGDAKGALVWAAISRRIGLLRAGTSAPARRMH